MNTTSNAKHRILALALCLLLAMVVYLPGPVTVRAELPPYGDDAEGKPWDGINFEALEGSGIYYGTYKHAMNMGWDPSSGYTNPYPSYENENTPVLWRAMGEEATGKLTLLSEYVLDTAAFNPSIPDGHVYDGSTIQTTLDTMSNTMFSGAEKVYAQQTNVITRMHDGDIDITTDPHGLAAYPVTTFNQILYLPWGKYNEPTRVYWDAQPGDTISSTYRLATNTATLKEGANNTDEILYWLRSPNHGDAGSALSVDPFGNLFLDFVRSPLGVRPAFQFDPESVIFTSEIGLEESKGGTPIKPNIYSEAVGGEKNYKLVIVNTDVKLDSLSDTDGNLEGDGSETLTIAHGGTLDLTGAISGGADNLVYKIVDRGTGGIVGYGAADSATPTQLTVRGNANVTNNNPLTLSSGNYTLYVWAQDNNDDHSHEGSQPMYFPLEVRMPRTDAALASVAGEPINTGSEAGTANDPHTDSISLGYSVDKITVGDIAPTDPNATASLYADAGFSANKDSDILLDYEIPTDLYIKVTAEDGTTIRYYKITATRSGVLAAYDITVTAAPPQGGNPTATPNPATATQLVTLAANPASGYSFDRWESASPGVTIASPTQLSTTFTMPHNDVDVVARYTQDDDGDTGGGNGNGDGGNTGGNTGGSSATRSSSAGRGGSSDRGGTTPDIQRTKTSLPASAFSWDGRALTIDHDSITVLGLQSVGWNGQTLERGTDYSVHSGSVIVRFDADFLAAQSPGDHTVRVEFLNHTAETTVTVGGTNSVEDGPYDDVFDDGVYNPNTGDGSRPLILLALLGCFGGTALAVWSRRKRV